MSGRKSKGASRLSSLFLRLKDLHSLTSMDELDRFVFFRMYQKTPTAHDAVKIRFWRSGRHWPQGREEMIRLGFALELDLCEMNDILKYSFHEPELYLLDLQELVFISMLSCRQIFTFDEAKETAAYYHSLYLHCRKQPCSSTPVQEFQATPLSEQIEGFHRQNRRLANSLFADFPALKQYAADIPQTDLDQLLTRKQLCPGWLPFLPPVPGKDDWMDSAALWMQIHWKVFDYAYLSRQISLIALARGYLANMPGWQLRMLGITPGEQYHYLRHIVYTDAVSCIRQENIPDWDLYGNHGYSQNFSSELQRYFKPGETLPRDTVIRLLLLFTMPDVNTDILSRLLESLGYAPLTASLTHRCGAHTDLFLMLLLGLFEDRRTGSLEKDAQEMRRFLRQADYAVVNLYSGLSTGKRDSRTSRLRQIQNALRIMKFRSLGENII